MDNKTADQAKQEKILERVAKLLAIAEHENTGEHEREVALAQANSLIQKHAIDEALLRQSQSIGERRAPEKRRITVVSGDGMGIALPHLRSILHEMAETYRCVLAVDGAYNADLYGASEDVAWVEMLFMSTYYELLMKIAPSWDNDKSYDFNVYTFKVAGFSWAEINTIAINHGGPDARVWIGASGRLEDVRDYEANPDDQTPIWEPSYTREFRNVEFVEHATYSDRVGWGHWEEPHEKKIKGSMITAYKRHAALIGDTQMVSTANHRTYRLYFLEGFKQRMYERLWGYQREMEREMDTIPGAALALADMTSEAKAMMYGDHPHLDPEEIERRRRKAAQDEAERLEAMSPQERAAYLEKKEREARRARRPRKERFLSYDESAVARGEAAANSVNMNRFAGKAEASDRRAELE
jgi:hypothetical protein